MAVITTFLVAFMTTFFLLSKDNGLAAFVKFDDAVRLALSLNGRKSVYAFESYILFSIIAPFLIVIRVIQAIKNKIGQLISKKK